MINKESLKNLNGKYVLHSHLTNEFKPRNIERTTDSESARNSDIHKSEPVTSSPLKHSNKTEFEKSLDL